MFAGSGCDAVRFERTPGEKRCTARSSTPTIRSSEQSVEHFVATEIAPNHARWTADGKVDKAMFHAAGEQGLLGMAIPEQYGGGGIDDFRYNAVIDEVVTASGASASGLCITLHNDICIPYFLSYCTDEQHAALVSRPRVRRPHDGDSDDRTGHWIRPGGYCDIRGR